MILRQSHSPRAKPASTIHNRLIFIGLAAFAALSFIGCASRSKMYLRDPDFELADSSKVILYVPLDSITVNYVDKTKLHPDTLFTDSFFLDAANSLFAYEALKRFTLHSNPEGMDINRDFLNRLKQVRYSKIAKNTKMLDSVSALIKATAQKFNVDLILLPYASSLRHITYQSSGWRSGGPAYERPTTYRASAATHIQIWNRKGVLLYECKGTNDAGRPIMYTLFGKKDPKNDMVKYAKHLYAPPLVRALYHSIQEAMRIKPTASIVR